MARVKKKKRCIKCRKLGDGNHFAHNSRMCVGCHAAWNPYLPIPVDAFKKP